MSDQGFSGLPADVRLDVAASLHFAVREELTSRIGQAPTLDDIAEVLAQAYGDALGLLVLAVAPTDQFLHLNKMAETAAQTTIQDVAKASCEGNA